MTTVTIDEELHTRVQAVAADEDLNGFVRAALQDYVERRERLAAKQAAARAEIAGDTP
jgi:predicted transcriptional regulator